VTLDAEIFLDAAYLIALGQPGDAFHARAMELSAMIQAQRVRAVTSRAVLLEVGSALSKTRHRAAAVRLLDGIQNTSTVSIVPLTEELARAGWETFRRRADKEWSWTDCISILLMQERGLRQALTTDEHFEQAGFIALLQGER
jgi:predicted nucleic acid-binding protein